MKREQVHSSAIRTIGFDAPTLTLEVEFTTGRVYRYFGVPEFLYRGFVLAQSKGAYFNSRIQNRYPHDEVR